MRSSCSKAFQYINSVFSMPEITSHQTRQK
jgi:hypothetical protein